MKLHLVDATFELFRAFYSPGPDVTHVAAATDHVIESWRNDVFPGYKSSVGLPTELLEQFSDAERALRALGIVTWAMVEDEADDAIATAVARFSGDPRVEQIVICSVDKDLAQCVDDGRIVLRDRIRRVTYDEAGVVAKFGVAPASIPDYLALVGDSSDGYPGLAGWGARSTAAVLARFGDLDAIPESPLDWGVPLRGASQLAAVLRDHKAEAMLYRRLARLNTDAAITGTLDDLAWDGVPRSEFLAICTELGFDRLRERVHRWADQPSV